MSTEEFAKLLKSNPDLMVEVRDKDGNLYEQPIQPAPAPPVSSKLAAQFEWMWKQLGGPPLLREHKFCPTRKWRADYCYLPKKVIIELEGGVWDGGRHTRGPGFINDIEKYNSATMLGYRVLRIATGGVVAARLQEMIDYIRGLP